jgi:hypothetical protein
MLGPDTIPVHSRDVVTRKDSEGTLLFQVRTDEMYFLSEDAFALYGLCDGSRTVAEIERLLARARPDLPEPKLRRLVEQFLESLADRNVVELWGGGAGE